MSAVQARPAVAATGVVSELAFARAQRNTVLIVDDLFSSRLLLAEIVRQIDGKLNLELFDTPSRALEFARNNRVDIVLTDYKLPEFDGIELVKQLRALPQCVDVPIVVITVVDDEHRVSLGARERELRDDAGGGRCGSCQGRHWVPLHGVRPVRQTRVALQSKNSALRGGPSLLRLLPF